MGRSTGRPTLVGNDVASAVSVGQSNIKNNQDLQRCLTISRLPTGDSAALDELTGLVDGIGEDGVALLIGRAIREMFAGILKQQSMRIRERPDSELLSDIVSLQVAANQDNVSYSFSLVVQTSAGNTTSLAGTVVS